MEEVHTNEWNILHFTKIPWHRPRNNDRNFPLPSVSPTKQFRFQLGFFFHDFPSFLNENSVEILRITCVKSSSELVHQFSV